MQPTQDTALPIVELLPGAEQPLLPGAEQPLLLGAEQPLLPGAEQHPSQTYNGAASQPFIGT